MAAWTDKLIDYRAQQAEMLRARILPYIRACLQMTMPWRLDGSAGALAFEQLFDSTGPTGVQRAASRLQRGLTPQFQRWFELEAGPLVPEHAVEPLNRQLMSSTAVILADMDRSAFHTASLDAYSDLMIGTGALLGLEGDDDMPVRWSAAPAWALAFEEGVGGRCDNVFWKKAFPAHMLDTHWPGAHWPEAVRRRIAEGSGDKIMVRQSSYYDRDLKLWRIAVQCLDGGGCPVVWDSARDRTNPWIVFRYWTTPGDPWGRGPVMLALPDIRTANKVVEMILTAAAYALAPPLMVMHDGVVNPDTMNLAPRSLIRVSRTGGPMGPSIAPLNLGGNVDVGQIVLEDQRQNITKTLLGRQLPPDSGAVRSASEIIERAKDLQYDEGAAFGRLNHEYVPQIIAREIDILDRKKVIGVNFDELRIDQLIMRVKVTSPLARSQNLEDVQTIVQFYELAKQVGGEEAFYHVANLEDGMPKLAKLMGVPLWAVNDPQQRAVLAKAAGQMAAQVLAPANDAPGAGGAPGGLPAGSVAA